MVAGVEIVIADLDVPLHRRGLVKLMEGYVLELTGGRQGLSDFSRTNLPSELAARKFAHVILAFVELEPVGLAICFEGFSTFACQSLLNIHDIEVAPNYRGRGLAKKLLQKIEELGLVLGCCKLTLEVLEGNTTALSLYKSFGFVGYELNPQMGKALFWEKKLAMVQAN